MKRLLLFIMLMVSTTIGYSEGLTSFLNKKIPLIQTPNVKIEEARDAVLAEDFNTAIYIYNILIEKQQGKRTQGRQVNNEILGEYAYVLALAGAQELSLINIDLAQNLSTPNQTVYYYISSILEINGFGDLSVPYSHVAKQPSWLKGKGEQFNQKYKSPILLSISNPSQAINHITECIKQSRYIEAMCYSSYLTQLMPSLQSGWLLQSAVFEKLGFYTLALSSYETGMKLSSSPQPGMATQLSYLQRESTKKGNQIKTWEAQSMVYGGLSYSNSNLSINGRYGIYSGKVSYSANMSIGIPKEGDCSFYTGLSCYYNINKFFAGLGIGYQTVGSSSTFTFSPTLGFSFINAKRTSSFDISLGLSVPCKTGMNPSFVLSIGKTFYFNSKGKSK